MIEVAIIIAVVIWFARKAKKFEVNPVLWGFIGALSFYIPSLITTFLGAIVFTIYFPEFVRTVGFIVLMILGAIVGIFGCMTARKVLYSIGKAKNLITEDQIKATKDSWKY